MLRSFNRIAVDVLASIVVLLMVCIAVQVVANAIGRATLISFGSALPAFGSALTINGLMDLQWHLLTLIGLLPMAIAWTMDRHVRVDFIYAAMPARAQAAVDLIGNIIFTLPFLWFATGAGWIFAQRAFEMAERSRDGGMTDRFLIKGVIPLALVVLIIAVALDTVRQLRTLVERD